MASLLALLLLAAGEPTVQTLTPPRLIHGSSPAYPKEAESQGLEAEVLLIVDIGPDGHVVHAEVKQGAGHGFDEAALAAAQQLVFSPALIDSAPTAVRIEYRYRFRLTKVTAPAEGGGLVPFRGTVVERGTRDPVAGASISIDGTFAQETSTEGTFALALTPGRHTLDLDAAGFRPLHTEEVLQTGKELVATYRLMRDVTSELEAIVPGERERAGDVVRRELVLEEIAKVPGTQGDALKVLQDLPGVARTPYGIGALVVRGAVPAGSKVFLDGIEIPALFHFGALSAVVNSDALAGMDFYPGNFSSRFGRADAGIVELRSRQGKERLHGYADVDLLNSVALAEGPLPGGGTFLASIRRSYVDVVLRAGLAVGGDLTNSLRDVNTQFQLAPRFYDYQLRGDWKLGQDHLWVMGLGADDGLGFLDLPRPGSSRDTFTLDSIFHRASGGWTRTFSDTVENRMLGSVGIDRLELNAGPQTDASARRTVFQLRDELRARELSKRLSLVGGLDGLVAQGAYDVTLPGSQQPGQPPPPPVTSVAHGLWSFEPALFAELSWSPFDALKLVPGARAEVSYPLGRWAWVDPRTAAWLALSPDTTLKASAGVFHRRPTPDQLLPNIGNPNLFPEKSIQASVGFEQNLPWTSFLDVQLYYNWLSQIAVRSNPPSDLFGGGQGEDIVLPAGLAGGGFDPSLLASSASAGAAASDPLRSVGTGHAYGIEVLLKRQFTGRFFGWIAYTLSRSTRLDATGAWHLFLFDQTHVLTALASYKLGGGWQLGARARLVSGNPYAPVIGSVLAWDALSDSGSARPQYRAILGAPYSSRLPAFFALDLRMDREWTLETWKLAFFLDVTNVTNRGNPVAIEFSYDYRQSGYLTDLPIFPTLGLKAEL